MVHRQISYMSMSCFMCLRLKFKNGGCIERVKSEGWVGVHLKGYNFTVTALKGLQVICTLNYGKQNYNRQCNKKCINNYSQLHMF